MRKVKCLGFGGLFGLAALPGMSLAQPPAPCSNEICLARQAPAQVARYITRQNHRALQQRRQSVTRNGNIALQEWRLREPVLLAQNGKDTELAIFDEAPFQSDSGSALGIWGTAQGFFLNQDAVASNGVAQYSEYEADGFGGLVGHDWAVGENGYAGVAAGGNDTDIEFQNNNFDDTEVGTIFGAAYGGWSHRRFSLDGSLAYSRHEVDSNRGNNFSSHDIDEVSANLSTSYDLIEGRSYWLAPFVAVEYSYQDEEEASEDGPGTRISTEDRETDSLRSDLGLRAGQRWETSSQGVVSLWGSLAWSHDFDIDDRDTDVTFSNAPAVQRRVEGPELEEEGGKADIGVSYGRRGIYVVALSGHAEIRSDFETFGGQLTFRKLFY